MNEKRRQSSGEDYSAEDSWEDRELNGYGDDVDFDETETNSDVAELTAYLDGELEPTQVFRVESRLNEDAEYLAQMQGLQKTWDLLDHLPNESSGNDFVRTTMELVVADAVKQRQARVRPWGRLWKGIAFLLIPFCFLTISYAANRAWQMQPHQKLKDNFDLILNLEKYQRVDSNLDFLVRLNDLELFSDEIAASYRSSSSNLDFDFSIGLSENGGAQDLSPDYLSKEITSQEIGLRIAALEPEGIASLQKNFEKLESMQPLEIQKLREFHTQLHSRPDSQRLLTVLNAYDEWLKRLGTSENHGGAAGVAEILDLPPADRLRKISRIRSAQIRDALGRWGATRLLNDHDVDVLLSWFELSINTNQTRIREQFAQTVPEYIRQQGLEARITPELILRFARRQPIRQVVAILFRMDRQIIEDIIFQDIDLLLDALSPEANLIIAQYGEANQKELVMNWIDAGIQAKATIPEEKLQVFYESLPLAKREELDQMSIEDWNSTLTRLYWEQNQDSRLFREWQIEVFGNRLLP